VTPICTTPVLSKGSTHELQDLSRIRPLGESAWGQFRCDLPNKYLLWRTYIGHLHYNSKLYFVLITSPAAKDKRATRNDLHQPEWGLHIVQRTEHSLKLFTVHNVEAFILDAAKFTVLLVLSIICTIFSIICLLSIGLGVALLSEQAATWFKTSQWHPVPLTGLLHDSSHALDFQWSSVQWAIQLLLSLESGVVLIVAAAFIWTAVLFTFDRALKKWRPAARI
jgi:hypothetical protein